MKPQYKVYRDASIFYFNAPFFLMFPLFQKYLNPQVRTKKLVNSGFLPRFSFKTSLKDTPFHISLNSVEFSLFPECLLNFLWLVYSTMFGKKFSIYGVHIPRKCIESMHFYSCSSPPLKLQVEFFENLFPPRRNGRRKLWFFNQKIWRWLETLVYLYFVWFVIFQSRLKSRLSGLHVFFAFFWK